MGRGGRIILDRLSDDYDDFWRTLDYTIYETGDVKPDKICAVKDGPPNTFNNSLHDRSSSINNNARTDFIKTEFSHNSNDNNSARTSVSDVFISESVSESQGIKQEPMEVQEAAEAADVHHSQAEQEEMTEFLRSVQSWYVAPESLYLQFFYFYFIT